MVKVQFDPKFKRSVQKMDNVLKRKVKKQIRKIIDNPQMGKPMRYARKNTREVYISPYRLSYAFDDDTLIFLALYHKKNQ